MNFTISSCQGENENQFVQIIVQPEVELNKTFDITITFRVKPDSVWTTTDQIENLELADELNNSLKRFHESSTINEETNKTENYYVSYNIATPQKVGQVSFPSIFYKIKGKEYKTQPFSITVVEKLEINENSLTLKLSSNKETYNITDTIKLNLFEFSKFDLVSRFTKRELENSINNLNLKGEQNSLQISFEKGVDDFVGIMGFEKYIDENFKIVSFDYNPFNDNRTMVNIDNETFIKTKVFEIILLPKHKGTFTFGPSDFGYFVTKSRTDDLNNIEPADEEGWHKLTKKNSYRLNIISNTVEVIVK